MFYRINEQHQPKLSNTDQWVLIWLHIFTDVINNLRSLTEDEDQIRLCNLTHR